MRKNPWEGGASPASLGGEAQEEQSSKPAPTDEQEPAGKCGERVCCRQRNSEYQDPRAGERADPSWRCSN